MKREHMVRQLAPVAPACFSSRDQWLEYLIAHAAEQRLEHQPGPLVFSREAITVETSAALGDSGPTLNVRPVLIFKDRKVTFNPQLNFCEECSDAYTTAMKRAGRCHPSHLRQLLIPEPA